MELDSRHVVLIGMMGAGKTTVGRLLARRLLWGFWDNDEALTQETGLAAGELQRKLGEEALHRFEDRLLRDALRNQDPSVLAAAGSVVLHPPPAVDAVIVWLRASATAEQQHIRQSGQHHRPLPVDALGTLERLGAERLPAYAKLADVTVDVADDPAATCERVVRALADLAGRVR